MAERISSGVAGLDKLIQGGIPAGSVVLATGAPGTGKTILAMQFLEKGLKSGERCAYVTIEELPEKIMKQALQFGFFKKAPEMISAKDIKYDIGAKKPEAMAEKIKLTLEKLVRLKLNRIVVDSVSSLTLEDGLSARVLTRMLIEGLNKTGATCLITGEALNGDYPDDVTPFLVDGVFVLRKIEALDKRSLTVDKLRQTNHVLKPQGMKIVAGQGITVEGAH